MFSNCTVHYKRSPRLAGLEAQMTRCWIEGNRAMLPPLSTFVSSNQLEYEQGTSISHMPSCSHASVTSICGEYQEISERDVRNLLTGLLALILKIDCMNGRNERELSQQAN